MNHHSLMMGGVCNMKDAFLLTMLGGIYKELKSEGF